MNSRIIELQSEISQHLIQLEGVINYLGVDIVEHGQFIVNDDIITAILWNAFTLVANARKVLSDLEIATDSICQQGGAKC
ncbi:hypothetical protein KRX11_01030 [Pasteurellaceae bacterium TAE3-ERU1]|nr:hypothetical protein [Pasteurellaceae bacterium TAE3-ERU1]